MRRRTIMIMVIMALMVAVFATAAYAAIIEGTSARDILQETNRNDVMYGYGGNDTLRAFRFVGEMDVLYGGRHNDHLNTADGDNRDTNYGGRGYDVCVGDGGDSFAPGCNEVIKE
jgi:hypothetical protein